MPRTINADDLASVLPKGARVLVQGGAGESQVLADAVEAIAASRPDLSFVGVFIPGVNERAYAGSVTTFFLTPTLKEQGRRVTFLPLAYTDIARYLRAARLDAALFTASPVDAEGVCSFGVAVDFLAELWPHIPLRIAHLNPAMPRTHGHPGVPTSEITAIVDARAPLLELRESASDDVACAVADRVAAFIGDGATVQAGIGKLPGACMRALKRKRQLRIHSGFISDWALELLAAGAIAEDAPIVAGLAIGSEAFYAELSSPAFAFRPVSFTHGAGVLRTLPNFVTVNAALEVDLFGQVHAECGPDGFVSGPGGASDFARGAKLAGGLRVIALPADAQRGAVSRIVAPGRGRGPVSLGRFDVDVVVTQHGAADLRGATHDERARRLIALAAPDHRAALEEAWARAAEAPR